MNQSQTFSQLKREQKEAVALLSIGTFLEYFDLMLYVHMAVLLNDLFFPKTDPHTASLISAFAFCSTFVFRPFGALIFGWIGDNIGRKSTVVITTFMMAVSCIIMANLPTYDKIGISAAWIVTICRIFQGMSSMGETVGAELYLTEITRAPVQYPVVAFITACCSVGGFTALIVAYFTTSYGLNWRLAFWIGAGIALVGGVARTALKETVDFVDAKRRLSKLFDKVNINSEILKSDPLLQEEVDNKTVAALFFMDCAWPACFYFAYIYCGNLLSTNFNYNSEEVIQHNSIVSIVQVLGIFTFTYLSYRIYPLKILKALTFILGIFILLCLYFLNNIKVPLDLMFIQSFIVFFILSPVPAMPIIYECFPVFKRFTCVSIIFALSRAVIYVATSFGLVYLTKYFGHFGIFIIIAPTIISFYLGLKYFEGSSMKIQAYNQQRLSTVK